MLMLHLLLLWLLLRMMIMMMVVILVRMLLTRRTRIHCMVWRRLGGHRVVCVRAGCMRLRRGQMLGRTVVPVR